MAAPDWEQIERDYRAGAMSVRAIGDKHGISEGAIRKRAKKDGWQRDLADQVKKATNSKLVRTSVRVVSAQDEMRTDSEIIEQASDEIASVIVAHRASIERWRNLANKLGDALEDIDITEDNHRSMSASITAGVDALGKAIKLERQAYGLDDERSDNSVSELSDLMRELSEEA